MTVAGPKNLLLCLTPFCAKFVPSLRSEFVRFSKVVSSAETFLTFAQLAGKCKYENISYVACSNFAAFKKFCPRPLDGTHEDNIGTYFTRDGLEFVLLPPLQRVWSDPAGRFLISRFLLKLVKKDEFLQQDNFTFSMIGLRELDNWILLLDSAIAIAVDIETKKEGLRIASCAYTGIFQKSSGEFYTKTCVVKVSTDSLEDFKVGLHCIRHLNQTKPPKIMQNGGYDSSYFLRWNCPLHNWLFDTFHMNHCIYAELKRDLASISSFYLQDFYFWKNENERDLYEYNAKDTHNTAWTFLGQLQHIRMHGLQYAIHNYNIEFPKVFPCIHCGQEGILTDLEIRATLRAKEVVRMEHAIHRLETVTRLKGINPGSPLQMLQLMKGMGYKFPQNAKESSDAKSMQAFSESHPLRARIQEITTDYREAKKAISTYFDCTLLGGRLLYEINAGGTDTGRLAAKASNYWCGTQIQNQPEYVKPCYMADEGWLLAEVDNSQSESRCTAYISEDENLINTVETSLDFHCTNCSLFFGMPFDQLYDAEYIDPESGKKGKVTKIGKPIRSVGKRINHGANYNMGEWMLWQTMGTKEVFQAARLLNLPKNWGPTQICRYLLSLFDKAYPKIKGKWYKEVIWEIKTTGKLVGATGWTRRTFLRPEKDKMDLNAAVAHPPQNLSVMLVNEAFYKVWRLQMEKYPTLMRIKAQIHDSILFQYKKGHEYIVFEVSEIMKTAINVRGRTMLIPNDPKYGAKYWGDLKD